MEEVSGSMPLLMNDNLVFPPPPDACARVPVHRGLRVVRPNSVHPSMPFAHTVHCLKQQLERRGLLSGGARNKTEVEMKKSSHASLLEVDLELVRR